MANMCPFCGHDPFHYVDNGLGMEAVAVNCCELGCEYFGLHKPETVEIDRSDFDDIARKLTEAYPAVNFCGSTPIPEGVTLAEVLDYVWVATNHNKLFHGDKHNTVIDGQAILDAFRAAGEKTDET
jgi:hypothetical protein